MKSLTDFINRNIKESSSIVDYSCDYTFEMWCNEHDIDDPSIYDTDTQDRLWEKYINNQWVPFEYEVAGYDYKTFLLETLLRVENSDKFKNKLLKEFGKYINDIEQKHNANNDYSYFKIYVDDIEKFLDNKKLQEFLHYSNWEAHTKDDVNYILLKPNKTEDRTEDVYNLPYVYHYCPIDIYERKIKKYGLQPKHKFGTKFEKTFVFYSKDPKPIAKMMAHLKYRIEENEYKKQMMDEGFVLLTLDLNKYKNKLMFYKDEESNNKNVYYTFEPIPPKCIVDVTDI